MCFSRTSRSDHVQSCCALLPQLSLQFPLQCPQETGKNFSVHHSHFSPPAAGGVGWPLAEGRASACCDPSFWCLEVSPTLFHGSMIPALLACQNLKEMLYLRAKRKSLQSQSPRGICRFLHPTAVHGTGEFTIFFFFGEAFGIWWCLSCLQLPACNRQ